jgi:Smg protein
MMQPLNEVVTMFEILMFLFENYMDSNAALKMDNETLVVELEKIGFDRYEINRALQWLDGLVQFQLSVITPPPLAQHAIRHYLQEEAERLGVEGRGFLIYLEQIGILDPMTREIAIDRIMALDSREVDLGRIKWVILMVLFSQPEKKSALTLMQDMVLADAFDVLH